MRSPLRSRQEEVLASPFRLTIPMMLKLKHSSKESRKTRMENWMFWSTMPTRLWEPSLKVSENLFGLSTPLISGTPSIMLAWGITTCALSMLPGTQNCSNKTTYYMKKKRTRKERKVHHHFQNKFFGIPFYFKWIISWESN